jgi:hypothetical protein
MNHSQANGDASEWSILSSTLGPGGKHGVRAMVAAWDEAFRSTKKQFGTYEQLQAT